MIRYILVDDCPQTLKKVKEKIDSISKDFDLQHIDSYNSSKKAFENIQEDDYDLLIVDFEMPVYNGIELAQKVASNKKIIILTSTTDNERLVINSLDISGYLSKPFEIEEFKNILKNKIIGKVNSNSLYSKKEIIAITTSETQDIVVYPDKTFYITTSRNIKGKQSKKNYIHFFGKNDEVIISNIRITVDKLSEKLRPYGFEKINKSTIVNIHKINIRNNKEITLINCREKFFIGENEKIGIVTKIRSLLGV